MNGIKQVRQNQQGFVLMLVMALLLITVWLVLTILDVASNSRKLSTRQVNVDQAMYVAEAGVERAARFMESNLNVMVSSSTGATNGSGSIGSGNYSYYIFRTNSSTYCIVSTGTVNGVSRVVRLLDVYQPTYAKYALWSHVNGALTIRHGSTFNGHVHADDELYFDNTSGGPVFHAAVTSDAGTYSGSITGIEFDQGLTLNSYQGTMADVDFNSAASTSLKKEAQANGLYLSGNTTITFNGGTLSISNTRTSWVNHSYTIPAKGIIYVSNNGTTSGANAGMVYMTGGTVQGQLTIASENDMHISGNITYVHDPRTTPSSTDALGLITQDSIWVDASAPTTMEIDAAMMTTGTSGDGDPGSFAVVNYDTRTPVGPLTIYGGIVQNTRGAVGTGSGGVTQTGFTKQYSYDPRFIQTPPPYYPTVSNTVSFAQWTEGN
jgi:hypothetical protein